MPAIFGATPIVPACSNSLKNQQLSRHAADLRGNLSREGHNGSGIISPA